MPPDRGHTRPSEGHVFLDLLQRSGKGNTLVDKLQAGLTDAIAIGQAEQQRRAAAEKLATERQEQLERVSAHADRCLEELRGVSAAERRELVEVVQGLAAQNDESLARLSECEQWVQAVVEAVDWYAAIEEELQRERVRRAAAEESSNSLKQKLHKEQAERQDDLRVYRAREEEQRRRHRETEGAAALAVRKLRADCQKLTEDLRIERQRCSDLKRRHRQDEDEKVLLMQRVRSLESMSSRLPRAPTGAVDRRDRWRLALQRCSEMGADRIDDETAAVLAGDLAAVKQREAWLILGVKEGTPGAKEVARRLMTQLHPDKVSVPAAKETLQKRFQLLNHVRELLP
eukprot:TRINITY_DN32450_c0_g1_i1.p2 TRINITY_DN32450_c0_g1~~TRINITY_DN32450_c0_g1_i1.p2  ORF type:complete len:360 (+),score=171.76 TRINITY_DN32450_c0_g1_i1:49-1080(+)